MSPIGRLVENSKSAKTTQESKRDRRGWIEDQDFGPIG